MLHDCLEPLGLSVAEAARHLGVSRTYLSDLVHCRAGITPEMAIRLDQAFGGEADVWYGIQAVRTIWSSWRRRCCSCRSATAGSCGSSSTT